MSSNFAKLWFVLAACTFMLGSAPTTREAKDFDPKLSYRLVKAGAILIDTRSPEEYRIRHVSGAVNIPFDRISQNQKLLRDLTKDSRKKPIVVYCRSGRRSAIAKTRLLKMGYLYVVNHGSLDAWLDKNP